MGREGWGGGCHVAVREVRSSWDEARDLGVRPKGGHCLSESDAEACVALAHYRGGGWMTESQQSPYSHA